MSEDPFEELVPECYICFEPCTRQAKCNCQTYVHKKCIQNYILKSGIDHCNVCLYTFKKTRTIERCTYYNNYLYSLFKCIVIYILSGILGQIIFCIASKKSIEIVAPWTDIFAISSIIVICIGVFLYAFVKRYNTISL